MSQRSVCILGAVFLLVAALVGWKVRHEKSELRPKLALRDAPDLRSLSRSNRAEDRHRAKKLKADYDAIFAAVLERNPGLVPKWKSVPDEENGFLHWLLFLEKSRGTDGMASFDFPEDVSEILSDPEKWNAEIIKAYVEKHADLLEELTRIGLLTGQSTYGISPDRWSFMEANIAKQSAEILCADARLAAESGDGDRALLRIKAVIGLSNHQGLVETPTLIAATVAILVKLTALEESMNHVLPALDLKQEDYAQWRQVLSPDPMMKFTDFLRGEGYGGMRGLVIPVVSNNTDFSEKDHIPDPDALYDAITQGYLHAMKRAESTSYLDHWQHHVGERWFTETPENLSDQSVEIYHTLNMGWDVYSKGWARAVALFRRYDAAFAILEGREPPMEVLTGKPFVYDSQTRVLDFPDEEILEGIKADELKLP
ncbi:hypothetical protein NT6N_29540 [Oceaniferula spumae]|uniref:DUF885 domain-containing protein n=1 Tax=Oceaniferula spumae TaxID=2979115 RepID=A0AAT9FPJ7_9BACT